MSNSTTQATVNLTLNGQQALQTLNQLRSNALQLETAIAKAAAAGNRADLKRFRKDLTDTRRQIREIESATQQVESVMRRLNRATPQELNKSLQTLNRQLQYIERGSEAWNAHVAKIKTVKAELARVNAELRVSETAFQRMNRILNDWQNTIMGGIAAFTGLTMAARKAVNTYAEMDEELANTRKYTGMSVEQVLELNEAFKKMDTRTPREQLNELAQEAGRLGKNTMEAVKGYVEAADIINVALVDLGAGATQTIAKLTNIFGVEELLGTKDAMLSVGSTVNVLSQNCTASKQYLVEFAQRMAGVGAQAKMTIPELLAFGATLDANGQKTEMSASALGKLVMKLFQEPADLARQVGLDIDNFTKVLSRSTTEGVIMFLEQIQKLGSIDGLAVLAPMFKDLGMDGVRMSQVLATLAKHLDMVKWEIGEANKAFKEATSATNEYNIFNNTALAGIEKARKRISELAVELGEKLLPVMRHVYTSGSLVLRLLYVIVSFITKYNKEIVTLTATIAAYTIGMKANIIATKAWTAATALWNTVAKVATVQTKAYAVAMVLNKDAIVGCSLASQRFYRHMLAQNIITKAITASTLLLKAAYYALTFDARALNATLKSLYITMKSANPAGLLLAAVTATAFLAKRQLDAQKERQKQLQEEMRLEREQMKEYNEQADKIKFLTAVLNDNTRQLQDRQNALNELKKIAPEYNATLDSEGKLVNNNTAALDNYLAKLKEVVRMKANREKLEKLYAQQQELEDNVNMQSDRYWKIRNENALQGYNAKSATGRLNSFINNLFSVSGTEAGERKVLDKMKRRLTQVSKKIEALESKVSPLPIEPVEGEFTPEVDGTYTPETETASGKPGAEDMFAEEKAWKQRELALNRIAYATGEEDYQAYTDRMLEIETEFHKKRLQHTHLSEDERISIEADYYEALRKQTEQENTWTIQEEDRHYNELIAREKQRYIDGETDTKTYEDAILLLELQHLQRMVSLTKEGTKERQNAERSYQERLLSDQKKHQQEAEKLEKKHQDRLKKIKEDIFGLNENERQAAYVTDLSYLDEVYQAEILAAEGNKQELLRIEKAYQEAKLALQKKYNIAGAADTKNAMAQAVEDSMEWLDSDGGKALTGTMDTLVSGMSSIFQQMTSIVQAELEIQTAAIEERYDREISLAEGNAYKQAQLERQKEKEIAQAKKEANKKQFAMQVIQAIAQTAQGAISAYSSAAAIPITGWILAPIAASMAVAAGMIQVAAIKKQQQASEASGYAEGGYTPKGGKYEEVGVVHAGEWVASQALLANPVASQMIASLDYAQRTNTIGSLRSEDVSRSITAPVRMADPSPTLAAPNTQHKSPAAQVQTQSSMATALSALTERLKEPFVTINTVEGDHGMKKAQEEYDKLIRNKTPKSRR